MKDVMIAILVAVVVVLGLLFFVPKNSNVNYQPTGQNESGDVEVSTDTFPIEDNTSANSTNTNSNNSDFSVYSGNGFKINYPKDITVHEENAEGGPYRVIYFGDAVVSYIWNPDFHEEHVIDLDYELIGTKTVNGNTFKIYQVSGETNNRFYLRVGSVAYEVSFMDNSRMSLDSFDLI